VVVSNLWSEGGSKLYYENKIKFFRVSVDSGQTVGLGDLELLFAAGKSGLNYDHGSDVSKGGKKLLFSKVGESETKSLALVQNWFREFQQASFCQYE